MPKGTAVATWIENGQVCLAVRVAEPTGNVEYVGRVPLEELTDATEAEKKTQLVAAVKAQRSAQQPPPQAAPAISGSVTL